MFPNQTQLSILKKSNSDRPILNTGTLAAFISVIVILGGCVSSTVDVRSPAESVHVYNDKKVRLLKAAAQFGVLLQIPSTAIRDVPSRQVTERCRTVGEPGWLANYFSALEIVDSTARGWEKIHVIEIKRGDEPGVEITKDLDGLTYLQLRYGKIETREKLKRLDDIPCADRSIAFLDQEMATVEFNWPSATLIAKTMAEAPIRPDVERWQFKKDFIDYLAEQQTVFRLNPEIAFEKSASGDFLLKTFMDKTSSEIQGSKNEFDNIRYWLRDISIHSQLGSSIKLFSLKKDMQLNHGVDIDSGGSINRRALGYADPTYLYSSYRQENDGFLMSDLVDMNKCLGHLTNERNSFGFRNKFDTNPESYLNPGFHCIKK